MRRIGPSFTRGFPLQDATANPSRFKWCNRKQLRNATLDELIFVYRARLQPRGGQRKGCTTSKGAVAELPNRMTATLFWNLVLVAPLKVCCATKIMLHSNRVKSLKSVLKPKEARHCQIFRTIEKNLDILFGIPYNK